MAYPPVPQCRGIASAFADAAILEDQDEERAIDIAISGLIGSAVYIESRLGRPRLLQMLGELSRAI